MNVTGLKGYKEPDRPLINCEQKNQIDIVFLYKTSHSIPLNHITLHTIC